MNVSGNASDVGAVSRPTCCVYMSHRFNANADRCRAYNRKLHLVAYRGEAYYALSVFGIRDPVIERRAIGRVASRVSCFHAFV